MMVNHLTYVKTLPFSSRLAKRTEKKEREREERRESGSRTPIFFGVSLLLNGRQIELFYTILHFITYYNIGRTLRALSLVKKTMFYQSIKHRKRVFYCFSPHYFYIIKQEIFKTRAVVFYHSVIHGLGFFIYFINSVLRAF